MKLGENLQADQHGEEHEDATQQSHASLGSAEGEHGLWGGRFKEPPAEELIELSRSTQFDWVLAPYDLKGSAAHAKALHEGGFLSDEELNRMLAGIRQLDDAVEDGSFLPDPADEDVHSALERGLIEILGGELGGKLRAGRSRNDQIATLIRLYLLDQSTAIRQLLQNLIQALVKQAEDHIDAVIPGRTHLQHAQPVLLAHHLLAHAWPIVRDIERLDDWTTRARVSPYGGGALAGNSLGLDANGIAQALGLTSVSENSIDGTASRDVVAEFAFICSLIGVNLSRFSEEIIFWATREVNFVQLHDSWSTGSSIMPQKKNPDIAELARGKSGRFIGNLTGLLTTLKALPLAYNRDLQEDKEPVFDSVQQLRTLLPAFIGMVKTLKFNTDRMAELAPAGFSLATDVAEWLVKHKVPFRRAHEVAGLLVQYCEAHNLELDELTDEQYASVAEELDGSVREVLTVEGSIASRDGLSGTAKVRVLEQLSWLKERIS